MAEEVSKFHQGWLHAREDGLPFAPYTVTSGVYNPDKTLLSDTIKNLEQQINTNATGVSSLLPLAERFGVNPDDIFCIADSSGNIIAQIDKDGIKSVDFLVNGKSFADLSSRIGALSNDNAFYITDNSGNIIFQVDSNGAKSINFTDKDGNSLKTIATNATKISNIESAIGSIGINSNSIPNYVTSTLANTLKNVNLDDTNILYVVDGSGNVIVQIDGSGLRATELAIGKPGEGKPTFSQSLTNINNNAIDISNLKSTYGNISTTQSGSIPNYVIETLENTLSNVNLDDSEVFYIVDKDGYVIMQVDGEGVYGLDFIIKKDGAKTTFSSALTNINNNAIKISNIESAFGENVKIESEGISNYVVDTLANTLRNVNLDDSEAFYITDCAAGTTDNPQGNVIMKVDAEGVHSVDFINKDGRKYNEIVKQVDENATYLNNLNNTVYGSEGNSINPTADGLVSKVADIGNRVQYISVSEDSSTGQKYTNFTNNVTVANELDVNKILTNDEIFTFSDKPDASGNANLIAQIDENGITAFDFITKNGNLNSTIANVNTLMTNAPVYIRKGITTIKINI